MIPDLERLIALQQVDAEAADARKQIASATSRGSPNRRSGTPSRYAAAFTGSSVT